MTVSGLEALTGISRGRPFAGQRIGLLTHPAAITGDGPTPRTRSWTPAPKPYLLYPREGEC